MCLMRWLLVQLRLNQQVRKHLWLSTIRKKNDTLDNLHMAKYSKKVSKSLNRVEPQSLPPTIGAAKYQSYRMFLQVQQWKSIDCSLQAEVWGWNLLDTGYFPRSTDLPPAPGELLKNIRCNCATDCSSGWCSCQKHGMKCSMACGQCRGSACSNASLVVEDEEEPDDQEWGCTTEDSMPMN